MPDAAGAAAAGVVPTDGEVDAGVDADVVTMPDAVSTNFFPAAAEMLFIMT